MVAAILPGETSCNQTCTSISNVSETNSKILDANSGLTDLKNKYTENLILGHLNINSIRNKFDALTYTINNNVDILLLSETKLDESFPSAQFRIKGFTEPYRSDRNSNGGGLLLYVREDIPSKLLKSNIVHDIETISVEINLGKRKWFLNCSYNPHKNFISHHLESLNLEIDKFSKGYENFIFIGDFNASINNTIMEEFCSVNNLTSLIKKPTCYKNFDQPSYIDLILTNKPNFFQKSDVYETGLSDFHLLTTTVFKMRFQKRQPQIIQ